MVKAWISFRYNKEKMSKLSNGRRWGRWRYIDDVCVKLTFLSKLIILPTLMFLSNLIFQAKLIFLLNYHLFKCYIFINWPPRFLSLKYEEIHHIFEKKTNIFWKFNQFCFWPWLMSVTNLAVTLIVQFDLWNGDPNQRCIISMQ